MKKPRLHVVRGEKPPYTPRQRVLDRLQKTAKPPGMIQCPRCAGREIVETKIGAVRKNGKTVGGTKQCLCAGCFMRGERVVVG